MNKAGERLLNGLVKENPTLVLMLGMCPTLAVTTSAVNGFGMGATTLVVLALSNLIISLLRKVIPKRVRIPAFIVIIASFVTIVQLLMQAYLYSLNKALGVYIPLIVVNCIILGRAESYAYSNPPIPALFDGIGMGLGFTMALTCIGAVRELLGAGKVFGFSVMPDSYEPALIFVLAPGAFFVLAALTALQNFVRERLKRAGKPYEKIGSGCTEDCMNCPDTGCARRFYDTEAGAPAKRKHGKGIQKEPVQEKLEWEKAIEEMEAQEELRREKQEREKAIQEKEIQEELRQEKQEQQEQGKEVQEEPVQEKQEQEKAIQEKEAQEEPVQEKQEQQEQGRVVQEKEVQEEPRQEKQEQGRVVQEKEAQEEPVQEKQGQGKAIQEKETQEKPAQTAAADTVSQEKPQKEKPQPAQRSRNDETPQGNKNEARKAVTQAVDKTRQNDKAAQSSGKNLQGRKTVRGGVGKAVQHDQASQRRSSIFHRKVPRQGRKKD